MRIRRRATAALGRLGLISPDRYRYSDERVGRFRSLDDAIRAHVDYEFDTDEEGQFDPSHPTYTRLEQMIDEIPPHTEVLDLGCNSGGLGRRLIAEKGCRMFGVDLNADLVDRATAKGYTAYAGAAEETQYDDSSFDVVVASEILEHVFDPVLVVREAHRVLRTGGLFFGDVPTEVGHWGFETIVGHPYHARVFTHDSLEQLLNVYFTVEAIRDAPEGSHPVYDVATWYAFRCQKLLTDANGRSRTRRRS